MSGLISLTSFSILGVLSSSIVISVSDEILSASAFLTLKSETAAAETNTSFLVASLDTA